jgi:RNA ligase (TIGR02306 family)
MRKLASIRRIDAITPIEMADSIECASVGGWKVVVRKGEFKPGDRAIYLEIDSWVPHALAPFLSREEPHEYEGVKGERLRTVKLRGQVSQGLLLPVPPELQDRSEGEDVTEALGVLKWEMPIPTSLAGLARGAFPSFVPKTDQERVQNLTVEELIAHGPYEITEKLDGASCTMGIFNGEFHVCSRNLDLLRDEGNAFWRVAIRDDIEAKLREARLDDIALQGELVGPGVQGNYYGLKELCFYIFDIYDIRTDRYYGSGPRRVLADALELQHVPILSTNAQVSSIEQALDLAQGDKGRGSSLLAAKPREGVVFKSANDDQFSFKAISNLYLLKEK